MLNTNTDVHFETNTQIATGRIMFIIIHHPAQSSRNYSRKKTNHSIKPHWNKSLSRTLNESHPVRNTNNYNLQELENEEENRTIPTIVNGVSMKTNSKYNLKNRNAPIDSINHCISDLCNTINDYNKMSVHSSTNIHKIILVGDSHIKGFANSL